MRYSEERYVADTAFHQKITELPRQLRARYASPVQPPRAKETYIGPSDAKDVIHQLPPVLPPALLPHRCFLREIRPPPAFSTISTPSHGSQSPSWAFQPSCALYRRISIISIIPIISEGHDGHAIAPIAEFHGFVPSPGTCSDNISARTHSFSCHLRRIRILRN